MRNPWRLLEILQLLWGYEDPSCLGVGVFDKNSIVRVKPNRLNNLLGEIQRTLLMSTGDYTMGNLTPLGNRENSDDFCGELRMRIFILATSLGNNKALRGRRISDGE